MDDDIVSFRVGDATITRVRETQFALKAATLYPGFDPSRLTTHRAALPPQSFDAAGDGCNLTVNTWVLRVAGKTILVDTGIGNHKPRPFSALFDRLDTPWLARLSRAGVAPEDVDFVLLTHLHADHVGWNTRLEAGRWVPTFPNARHVFARAEREFYETPASANRRMIFDDSVLPVIEAGLADEIRPDGGDYLPGIRFHPTLGHSAGHMSIEVDSGGAQALFTGDVWHHPVQVFEPGCSSVFCADGERAASSRRWIMEHALDTHAMLFTPHFPGTSAGTLARRGDGDAWLEG
ncbi:Beta-lactamase-like protein [Caballeronia arationis]|jgi:glyoxylase-like metal-dependent hydrolase (beta-lactamase superfamily II)|uniref:MBL fold metallo-hydrolase n=1 Tax=Caballeronia arationis TaxID=1777142 RepID=UPI00074B49B0|nr:MBL fold metallo-hydrolase [Caballeronia arationis]SAL01578.1 Beta-lactamase-like protein [Caballeronia arationis]